MNTNNPSKYYPKSGGQFQPVDTGQFESVKSGQIKPVRGGQIKPDYAPSTTCNKVITSYTIAPFLGVDVIGVYVNFAGSRSALFELTNVVSTDGSILPAIASGANLTTVNLLSCWPQSTHDFSLDDKVNILQNPIFNSIQLVCKTDFILELVNLQGQALKKYNLNKGNHSLDVGNLSSGIYFLHFISDKLQFTEKLVKE